jgi:CRISPR/Cas system-associated exonuclease Cas4 (RecB family)
MGFRPAGLNRIVSFNSQTSYKFLSDYNDFVTNKIRAKSLEPKHRTFAMSYIRCRRISWFRLRGVLPDKDEAPDLTLNFTADVGTACHKIIQSNLSELYGDNWIDVEDYLSELNLDYEYTVNKTEFETQVEIVSPPIRFSCDGLIKINGEYYLIEIKTADYSSFDSLTEPKPQHVEQAIGYATVLKVHKVLFVYQDRQYGNIKCFEIEVSYPQMVEMWNMFSEVQKLADACIAPPKLPYGDVWCSSSRCPYFKKCKEW